MELPADGPDCDREFCISFREQLLQFLCPSTLQQQNVSHSRV